MRRRFAAIIIAAGAALGAGTWLTREALSRAELVAPRATEIVYDRHGAFLTQIAHAGVDGYGYWPLAKVPQRLAQATLALEDRRFYSHNGVDVLAIIRAAWKNVAGRGAREGASTIAMQVARMQNPAPRGLTSKIMEAATGVAMVWRHGHDAVLAHYLRLAPYGAGSHGAAQAARFYFDKPLEDLSWAETALLVAVPQSPGRMNLSRESGLHRAALRARKALDELRREGVIDIAQAALAKDQLAAMKPFATPRRPEALHLALRYERLVREGKVRAASDFDPRIHASVDLGLQEQVTRLARRYLNSFRGAGARQVAVMVAERGGASANSNAILAEVGSARFDGATAGATSDSAAHNIAGATSDSAARNIGGATSDSAARNIGGATSDSAARNIGGATSDSAARNIGGAFDFTRVTRSPGSTLKPFVYALAFERGALKATDLLGDVPEGASGVNNADGIFLGPMPPRQALANSRNVPAANLLRRVGVEANFHFLHDLGLHDLEAPAESFGISMAIGSLPTKLERLLRAYAALADDGILSELVYAREQKRAASRRVMSEDTARLVTSMLADPQARLPTFPRYGPLEYPFAVAVKTGTSQGYRDAWTLAFSKKYVIGVWLGRADAGTMKELGGAASSARLAHALLTQLHGGERGEIDGEGFPSPRDRTPVDLCLGGGDAIGCSQTLREWVKPGETPVAAPATILRESEEPRLAIATPEHNTHIWRNPEQPASLNRLALKLAPGPQGAQIVWYVDGEPFQTAEADQTVYWPLRPGAHQIQARLALQPGASRKVKVMVE